MKHDVEGTTIALYRGKKVSVLPAGSVLVVKFEDPEVCPIYTHVIYSIVLFCFVLFCFVLFCFVLFCFVLFCFVLFYFIYLNLVGRGIERSRVHGAANRRDHPHTRSLQLLELHRPDFHC